MTLSRAREGAKSSSSGHHTHARPTSQITQRREIYTIPRPTAPPVMPMIASSRIGTMNTKTVEANLLSTVRLPLACGFRS